MSLYNYSYRNPYNRIGDDIIYGLGSTVGAYKAGQYIGEASGMGERQTNIFSGLMAGVTGLNALSSIYRGRQDREEQRRNFEKLKADSYYNIPYDRYGYNPYLNNSFNQLPYQDGGITDSQYENYEDIYGPTDSADSADNFFFK